MRYLPYIALGLPSLLFCRWMLRRWRDTTSLTPVSAAWQREDNRRRDALGAEGVCWSWPVKR